MTTAAKGAHKIEGLAAAGRLADRVPAWLAERAEFVAGALVARGLDPADARVKATFLNGAYSGLQADYLSSGDRERAEAAIEELCALADSWTENRPPGNRSPSWRAAAGGVAHARNERVGRPPITP